MLAPTEQDLPRPGEFVGAKYRIEEVLGRGGMGAVFRVTHSVTGKSFAVKWLLPQFHVGQEVSQRFIREAQVAGRVDHPNIVEVYDIGEDRGSMYMVMELLQGESLAQHLARVGRVPPSQACQLLIPVARGLAAAHRSGIIHRDLKPDNIFLSVSTLGEPRPKILDFGISKMSALATDPNPALTREGVVMGTPSYMAPEQLRSHKVDERCDIYALGVILYQMLGGKLPFIGENFPDLMLKIVGEAPVPLTKLAPEVPRELVAIVERAMARSPAERFGSVADFGRALEPFGQGALFDVEQALSTRPPSSVLPGPATPVATESSFPNSTYPNSAAQSFDLLQRMRRMAFPLAISGVSALLFSWIYVSAGDLTTPTPASAAGLQQDSSAARAELPTLPLDPPREDVEAQARQPEQDALPVPVITHLDEAEGAPPVAQETGPAAEAPALIGKPESAPDADPPVEPRAAGAEPAAIAQAPQQLPAPAQATIKSPASPAGIIPPPSLGSPTPVPPPGAAQAPIDVNGVKVKQKKAPGAHKTSPKQFAPSDLRMKDFYD